MIEPRSAVYEWDLAGHDARILAQLNDLIAGDLVHSANDLRVPHVPPWSAGSGPDVQDGNERHVHIRHLPQGLKIAPRADRGEAP